MYSQLFVLNWAQAYANVTFVEVTWLIQMLMYFTGLVALIFPPNALLVLGECFYTFGSSKTNRLLIRTLIS